MQQAHSKPNKSRRQAESPKNNSTGNCYQPQLLIDAFSDQGYFKIYRPFYRILKKLDVLFVHDLINLAALSKKKDGRGYFLCTTEYLSDWGWTPKEQEARLRSLRTSGYIQTDMRRTKHGWRRWLLIDIVSLAKNAGGAGDVAQTGSTPNGDDPSTPNGAKNKYSFRIPNKRKKESAARGGAATPPTARGGGSGDFKPLNGKQKHPVKNPVQQTPKKQPSGESPGTDGAATPHPYRQGNPRKEESMARAQFFVANEQSPKTRKVQPAEQDFGYAEALHGALVKKGMGRRPWSRIKWATFIAKARKAHGDDRFAVVFPWYLKHVGDEFIPQAFCGRSVYEEFDKIEMAMKRDLDRNPDVVVTAEGRVAAERLIRDNWPAGFAEQMPAVIEVSAANLNGFAEKVRAVKRRSSNGYLTRFCDKVLNLISNPYRFARDWVASRHDWVTSDRFQNRGICSIILKPEKPQFGVYVLEQLGDDWTERWQELVKEVGRAAAGDLRSASAET